MLVWFEYGLCLVWVLFESVCWYHVGILLVWFNFGFAMVLTLCWYAVGTVWYNVGIVLILFWYGCEMVLVCLLVFVCYRFSMFAVLFCYGLCIGFILLKNRLVMVLILFWYIIWMALI